MPCTWSATRMIRRWANCGLRDWLRKVMAWRGCRCSSIPSTRCGSSWRIRCFAAARWVRSVSFRRFMCKVWTRPAVQQATPYQDLIVEDNVDRSILKIRDRRGNGVQAVTGNIRLERNGRSEMIEIDEEWLKEMRVKWRESLPGQPRQEKSGHGRRRACCRSPAWMERSRKRGLIRLMRSCWCLRHRGRARGCTGRTAPEEVAMEQTRFRAVVVAAILLAGGVGRGVSA